LIYVSIKGLNVWFHHNQSQRQAIEFSFTLHFLSTGYKNSLQQI